MTTGGHKTAPINFTSVRKNFEDLLHEQGVFLGRWVLKSMEVTREETGQGSREWFFLLWLFLIIPARPAALRCPGAVGTVRYTCDFIQSSQGPWELFPLSR